jgi:PAS domain S-box-containing protein
MSANKPKSAAAANATRRPAARRGGAVARQGRPSPAAEAQLHKLNRTYAVLSAINQAILRVRETAALFDAVCRIAVEQGEFHLAWIGLLDAQTRQVRPVAQAGLADGYLEKLDIRLADSERGRGPTATALRSGERVVVNDIEHDPRFNPWRADAQRLGYRASAAFPLVVAGEVRGTLNLYTREPGFFDADELKLLDELAADVAFALEFSEENEQRRQAELKLQESEQRYQTLAYISPVGIFRTDRDGATTYVNPRWCDISGVPAERALGDGWLAAVHPDDRERLAQSWQAAVRYQAASFSDYRFVRPDGTITWVMGQAMPELNAEHQIIGYVGTITDITERKRVEAELQASERQLALIYARISDILYYVAVEPGPRYRFVSVNKAFLAATGLAENQVVGQWVQEVIPDPAHALVLGNYQEAIRTGKTVSWEEVSEYPAGRKFGEVSVTPVLDDAGLCIGLIGTVHDITERVNATAELRRLNTELEARVAQRTAELSAAMLRALEADRLKSAFLATMSHELRTPLNSIIGFTGVLLQGLAGPLNPEQAKQLGMIRDSARHLLELINDVLDISKIEAGQLEVARAPFDMRAAIEASLRVVWPQAQKKGLEVRASIATGVGSVVSDRRRVEQILLNLLSNAVKFTERGEVELACRAQAGWLETSVRDSGIGIDPDDVPKLFQPFHQLETGLNRRHEGTGLGLAICQNLVTLLGGQIRVDSAPGAGSTFTFTLPLAQEGAPDGEHPDH